MEEPSKGPEQRRLAKALGGEAKAKQSRAEAKKRIAAAKLRIDMRRLCKEQTCEGLD